MHLRGLGLGLSSSVLRRVASVSAIMAALFASACGSSPSADPDDEPTTDQGTGDDKTPNAPPSNDTPPSQSGDFGADSGPPAQTEGSDCQKVDIVFVIDDSNSMGPKQENLAQNFPKFVEVIEGFRTTSGGKLDWRAAVTTTTVGGDPKAVKDGESYDGIFRQATSCKTTQRWVEGSDPDVATKFGCLAKVGTGGSNFEEPLHALSQSLTERMTDKINEGFRRDDALLAVVVLTDEEDGSDGSIDSYIQMLNTAAHGPGRWAFAAIAADGCPLPIIGPQTSKRLKDLVAKAGKAGKFSTICPSNGDLTPALKEALGTFDAVCKTFAPAVN